MSQRTATRQLAEPSATGASRRSLLTLADQGVSSASNFAVAVVVAHLAGIRGLGVFSVGYAAWLLVASLHRSLITDPMTIERDARSAAARQRIRVGLAAEVVLGTTAACLTAATGAIFLGIGAASGASGWSGAGEGLLTVAIFVPFLSVQDFWRWVGFMAGRPGRSLANDCTFAGVQALAFVAIALAPGRPSPGLVIGGWGLGALAGCVYGCWTYRLLPRYSGGIGLLTSRWQLSRWLVGNDLALWGTNQGYLLLAGLLLGPVELGGLKAAQTLVTGPAFVLLQAGGSIGLPEATSALALEGHSGLRRVTRRMSLAAFVAIGGLALIVIAFGGQLLGLVYGSQFRSLHTAASLLAVAYAVGALGLGPIMALKATRRTRTLFADMLTGLTFSLVGALALAHPYGINGVAAAAILGFTVQVVLLWNSTRSGEAAPRHARSQVTT
jgi:O-antigen/teichoic acid export membrane protein